MMLVVVLMGVDDLGDLNVDDLGIRVFGSACTAQRVDGQVLDFFVDWVVVGVQVNRTGEDATWARDQYVLICQCHRREEGKRI